MGPSKSAKSSQKVRCAFDPIEVAPAAAATALETLEEKLAFVAGATGELSGIPFDKTQDSGSIARRVPLSRRSLILFYPPKPNSSPPIFCCGC